MLSKSTIALLLGVHLLITGCAQLAGGRVISEDVMRKKWLPAGVRAYVEYIYVGSRDQKEMWRHTGKVAYEAAYSRVNNHQLLRPVADLRYFCEMSGNEFRMTRKDATPFIKPSELRPDHIGRYLNNFYGPSTNTAYFSDRYRAADSAFAVLDAQDRGAWGSFGCYRSDGSQAWWASLVPSTKAIMHPGTSFFLSTLITVHETPEMTFPKASPEQIEERRKALVQHVLKSSKSVEQKLVDVNIEAWSNTSSTDRWGCKEVFSKATYGDRVIRSRKEVVCLR